MKNRGQFWRIEYAGKDGRSSYYGTYADNYEEAKEKGLAHIRGKAKIISIVMTDRENWLPDYKRKSMKNPKRKFTAKQIAAQKRFAAMAKAGTFRKRKKSAKRNPKNPESYWTYKAPPTPTFDELPDGAFKGTEADWHSLTPGMRREIVRQYERYVKPKKNPVKAGAKRKPPKRNPRSKGKWVVTWFTPFDQGYRAFASYENAERFAMAQQYEMIRSRAKLDTQSGRDFYEKLRDAFNRRERSIFLKFDKDMEIGLKFDTSQGLKASRSTAPTFGPDAKRNPVKTGAKRNPVRGPSGAFLIRAQAPVKSGYKYYFLRGDQFVMNSAHADTWTKESGERKMREILPKLPRAIASITLVKA